MQRIEPQLIPVTIIGGFLGSGKTTLVNYLLRHADGERLTILVNDFGELPIDADLIEADDGDIISLSGGCVCCSYGNDLSLALVKLQSQSVAPDHILVEASGVALPGAIAQSLSLLRSYQLQAVVVLADASSVLAQAEDRYVGDTIHRQLRDADLIVLNKLDQVIGATARNLRQWLTGHFPDAVVIDAAHSIVDPALLLRGSMRYVNTAVGNDLLRTTSELLDTDQTDAGLNPHHGESLFESIIIVPGSGLDAHLLAAQLASKESGLVRAKGFVSDIDDRVKTIQVVGKRWSVTSAPSSISGNVKPGFVGIGKSGEINSSLIRTWCCPR